MKISVDADRCSGHARCNSISESLFPQDDEGYNAHRGLGEVEVPQGSEDAAREAAGLCPELAIEVCS